MNVGVGELTGGWALHEILWSVGCARLNCCHVKDSARFRTNQQQLCVGLGGGGVCPYR